jgi:hypothetical protein
MINREDGSIHIESPDFLITRALTREQFVHSTLGTISEDITANPPWPRYWCRPIVIGGEQFASIICFEGERLHSFDFASMRSEFGTSWADASLDGELAPKRFHEDWLEQVFISRPEELVASPRGRAQSMMGYEFSWGRVASVYDDRAGGSSIIVRYGRL